MIPDIPTGVQGVLVALLSVVGTVVAGRIAARGKDRELDKDAQSRLMDSTFTRLSQVEAKSEALTKQLDEVQDKLRALEAKYQILSHEDALKGRFIARVAQCPRDGCPCAARAAEFGGTP